jgi:hypothetical protein
MLAAQHFDRSGEQLRDVAAFPISASKLKLESNPARPACAS